jgi:hypothetical protein
VYGISDSDEDENNLITKRIVETTTTVVKSVKEVIETTNTGDEINNIITSVTEFLESETV